MKLHNYFKTFLDDFVNLNRTRLTLLENSVDAVKIAVRELEWGPKVTGFAIQGSWAHQTIIKPQKGKPFDADILVFVEPVQDWAAKDYVNTLATALANHPLYKDKIRRFSHCATIEYVGDRKIDIAPCVVGRQYTGRYEVCNRITDDFEHSEPIGYTEWVNNRNGIAGGNDLKKVTRLIKYLRDIKKNFAVPSFILTTLLGDRIYDSDRYVNTFPDLTTTLKVLFGRLDDWLQAHPQVPQISNPVLLSEDQAENWNSTKYANFREKVNLYRGWIDDAYEEEDLEESIAKWRRVFGENFAASEVRQAAEKVSESFAASGTALEHYGRVKDLVTMVKEQGVRAIPQSLIKLPHVNRSKWRHAQEMVTVRVIGALCSEEHGPKLRTLESGEVLKPGSWINFDAVNHLGIQFSTDMYKVRWRVTNTDKVAADANALRGEFYLPEIGTSRREKTEYRGVHFVEAFLVRKRDSKLAGKSIPFYVVIE